MNRVGLALLGALWAGPVLADTPPLLLQAAGQTLMPVCSGRDLQIEGNRNVIKPFGVCQSLLLKGVANQVVLDVAAGAAIRVEGGTNQVTYHAPMAAVVTVLGTDNAVIPALVPELVPAASLGAGLQLSGDDQSAAADCSGRNVTVQGQRALYLLRGGCKSLTIRGDLVTVQAEMLPNAPISVTGHGNRVGWMQAGPGRAPTAAIRGEANQVERLGMIGGIAGP